MIITKKSILIVELKSYNGNDTRLQCIPNPLYMVVDSTTGKELDNGYRSFEEAKEAWGDYKIVNKEDDINGKK